MSVFMVWLQLISLPKRVGYTILSLLVCVLELGLLITEAMMCFVFYEFPPWRNHIHFILVLQTGSFFWALLGSVYALVVDDHKTATIALTSVALNLGTCISRVCYEIMLM